MQKTGGLPDRNPQPIREPVPNDLRGQWMVRTYGLTFARGELASKPPRSYLVIFLFLDQTKALFVFNIVNDVGELHIDCWVAYVVKCVSQLRRQSEMAFKISIDMAL